jgi:hypothetical protein
MQTTRRYAEEGESKVKPIRMLGLAVLAALTAMAFAGAGSAMAESTALCSVDPGEGEHEVCPAGNLITHVHAVTAAGNPALILSSVVNVACTLLLLSNTVSSLSEPLVLSGNFSYSGCKTGSGSSCTVTEVSTSNNLDFVKLGHEKADLTLEFEMNVHCGFFINCTYNGEGLKGIARGGLLPYKEGEEEFDEQPMHKTAGPLCPETTILEFWVNSLEAVYITN